MNNIVEFNRTQKFLGRNGVFQMTGIVVERCDDHLYLAPITSKGRVGRAYLLVPIEQAREVADLIQRSAGNNAQH